LILDDEEDDEEEAMAAALQESLTGNENEDEIEAL